VVTIIVKGAAGGWWKGELNGKVGKFPSNYGTLIATTKTSSSAADAENKKIRVKAMFNFTKRKETEVSP
jgi:hypothetical protein